MQCKHCLNHYTPCKYNSNRQKYCSKKQSLSCYRKRKAKEAQEWRRKNPDYFKNDTERTSRYTRQKNEMRGLTRRAKSILKDVKREFVAHLHASANILENQLLTFLGLLSFLAGGLDNASILEMRNRLKKCYENGVILKESDPTLKSYLENIYELTKPDQSTSGSSDSPPLQLAGSSSNSRGAPEKDIS